MSDGLMATMRTFYVVEKEYHWWPRGGAPEAIFEDEDSAHEFLTAIDVDGLKISRVAVRVEAGYPETVKGWPR